MYAKRENWLSEQMEQCAQRVENRSDGQQTPACLNRSTNIGCIFYFGFLGGLGKLLHFYQSSETKLSTLILALFPSAGYRRMSHFVMLKIRVPGCYISFCNNSGTNSIYLWFGLPTIRYYFQMYSKALSIKRLWRGVIKPCFYVVLLHNHNFSKAADSSTVIFE